jgi:hypothetical protein
MSVYAVLVRGLTPPDGLEAAIGRNYNDLYQYSRNIWFIDTKDTPKEVAEKLNLKKGGTGRTLIVPIGSNYTGMSQPPIWDWLKAAFEKSDD